MKYKVGDRVRVKEWGWLTKEYDFYSDTGSIIPPAYDFGFTTLMKEFCGQIVEIKEIKTSSKGTEFYKIKEDNDLYNWQDWMFSGYGFSYGEEIEVSYYNEKWVKRIYVGYIDGGTYPYITVKYEKEHINNFNQGKPFAFYYYKYARPIQEKHTIIIDGKEIEISEESYINLKKALIEGEK